MKKHKSTYCTNFDCSIRKKCIRSDYNRLRQIFDSYIDINCFNCNNKKECEYILTEESIKELFNV